MDPQTKNTLSPVKQARRKKGYIYLAIAIALFIILLILWSVGIQGGIIFALVDLGMFVFLIIAIVFLIRGYWGKG